MTGHAWRAAALMLIALGALGPGAGARAQPFWQGKNVQLLIGAGSGGGYDISARMIARHLPKHLPGAPAVVPQNMPSGGGIGLGNFLYAGAPSDGTSLGVLPREIATAPLMGNSAAKFDPVKFAWIGTPTAETNTCLARGDSPVRTHRDLFDKELIVGDAGPGNGIHIYPKALRALFGMKFRQVAGYTTSAEIFLALERGEVDGICVSFDSVIERYSDWLQSGKIRILLQGGAMKNPALPDVPFVMDLARNEEERQALNFLYAGLAIGRPVAAPPATPADRVKALRDAFDATMKDPEFIADAQKSRVRLDPTGGAALAALVEGLASTPQAVRDKVANILQ